MRAPQQTPSSPVSAVGAGSKPSSLTAPISRDGVRAVLLALLVLLAGFAPASRAHADDRDLIDRPVGRVVFSGLARLTDAEARTNLRVAPGQPYDPEVIRSDVATLYRLGQFRTVIAEARLESDGTVTVVYAVTEQAIIGEVQVVGNRLISDQELRTLIPLFRNSPRDDFLIEQAVRDIKARYRERGHYLADVQLDESRLVETGILIFRIVEGPRVRIREIAFEGNEAFEARLLRAQIRTKPAVFLFRRGQLDDDVLIDDVAALDRWYRDRGFVDVRVDRRIDISPDNREAKVTFVIAEGRRYRVRRIRVQGFGPLGEAPLKLFSPEQLIAMLPIQPGDVYSQDVVRRAVRVISDAYGILGHIDVDVEETGVRAGEDAEVDMLIFVDEGLQTTTGIVRIQGNFLTRDRIIRRDVRLQPGRPMDGRELVASRERLERTRLFGDPIRIAVQAPDAEQPDKRDVLVEVRERNTGSVNFGLALGSDSGVFGELSIRQDNFDIGDRPHSFDEFIRGRAFRGAGQRFTAAVAPGVDVTTFLVSLGEPRLLDSEIGGQSSLQYRFRNFDGYQEQRFSGVVGLSRRLGDLWAISATTRLDRVRLSDLSDSAVTEAFEQRGPDWLNGLQFRLTRTDVDRPLRPTRGTVLSLSFEQVGLFGGDQDFSTIRAESTAFITIDEDFLGRRSVLRLNAQVGRIFGGAPLYERFYLGGRSLRGFEFRTVSPKGIRNDTGEASNDPVGGEWLLFLGGQYEFPLISNVITGVVFADSGTVTDEPKFDEFRLGVGAGIRLYIPQFGPVPIAFDFTYPVVKEESDRTTIFSFSAEVPFR